MLATRRRTMRTSIAKTNFIFAVALLVFTLGVPMASRAKVFFSENFDDGQAAVESRWGASCGADWLQSGVFSLDTSQHVSGTASLKEVVNGLTTRVPEFMGAGTCFIDHYGFSTDTFFIRWYERTDSAFQYDPNNNKTINIGDAYAYPSWWFGHFQDAPLQQLVLVGQAIDDGGKFDDITYEHNNQAFSTPTNQWVCVEAQLVMNTPGVANGILRLWENGILVSEYLNQDFRVSVSTPACPGCDPDAHFNIVRLYAQHGVGTRWFDDIEAADTRIGCASTPAPPAAPTGLTVK